MKILYLDKLSIASLAGILLRGYAAYRIFFFKSSGSGKVCAKILITLRILRNNPESVNFTLAGLTDKNNESVYIKIKDDILRLSLKLYGQKIAGSELCKYFSGIFDSEGLKFYFSKAIAADAENTVIYLHAALQHALRLGVKEGQCVFLIERSFCSTGVCRLAIEMGLEAFDYPGVINNLIYNFCEDLSRHLKAKLSSCAGYFTHNLKAGRNSKNGVSIGRHGQEFNKAERKPCLATWYAGQTITFDRDRRSVFFWLLNSNLTRNNVLLYFSRTDVPLTEIDAKLLKHEGIEYVALNTSACQFENVPVWRAGKRYQLLKTRLIRDLCAAFLRSVLRGQMPSCFLVINMLYFLQKYAYWFDFFKTYNVKINFSIDDFLMENCPRNIALRHCGGVSVSYQYANLWVNALEMGYFSDLFFAFGPEYRHVLKHSGSNIKQLFFNGYPTDNSFAATLPHAVELRQRLKAEGVKFSICFLDENSSDSAFSLISNDESARIYKFFMNKVIADPSLGLICKPGYPRTLRKRLVSISDLIDSAYATKRCVFLDSGTYVTDKYPSEAAQAADVCVGLLLGGAAGMESSLAGTPTVYLDNWKFYSHPLYETGKDRVVFDTIEGLYLAIDTFRTNPNLVPGFGDLSAWLSKKVSFQDGNAAGRIGAYLGCLLEAFQIGKSGEEAISYANVKFCNKWGTENLEILR